MKPEEEPTKNVLRKRTEEIKKDVKIASHFMNSSGEKRFTVKAYLPDGKFFERQEIAKPKENEAEKEKVVVKQEQKSHGISGLVRNAVKIVLAVQKVDSKFVRELEPSDMN